LQLLTVTGLAPAIEVGRTATDTVPSTVAKPATTSRGARCPRADPRLTRERDITEGGVVVDRPNHRDCFIAVPRLASGKNARSVLTTTQTVGAAEATEHPQK
jgi:hypothetical protein